MRQVIRAGNPQYQTIHFSWYLTNWCNFSCEYCSSAGRMIDRWQHQDSISQYKLTLAKLKKLENNFEMDILGGEPTLHPHMEQILIELKSIPYCKYILVATNLSRSLSYYQNLDRPELAGVEIAASLHPDYVDNKFMQKVLVLCNSKYINFSVTVVMSDKKHHWANMLEIIQLLRTKQINYTLQILSDTDRWEATYTQEFYDMFRIEIDYCFSLISKRSGHTNLVHKYEFDDGSIEYYNDFDVYEKRLDRFRGFVCKPLFYEINFAGDISNVCTGRKINKLVPKAEDFKKEEICPLDCCTCESMFNFSKEKPE